MNRLLRFRAFLVGQKHAQLAAQKGAMNIGALITSIILGVVGLVIIGNVILQMWPQFLTTNTAIQVLTTANTDIGTKILAVLWPFVGLGLIAGLTITLLIHFLRGHSGH